MNKSAKKKKKNVLGGYPAPPAEGEDEDDAGAGDGTRSGRRGGAGRAIHSHNTFSLNLRFFRGKYVLFIGGER